MMSRKPALSFWQIWNMCFGFLGIQFGFALQNANVSRIFQTLGADVNDIPMLWVAAPLSGLIVQPIVGYLSDRTWTRLGRRRPRRSRSARRWSARPTTTRAARWRCRTSGRAPPRRS